jgi:electron transfer flavoprotein alpha subunit
MAVLLIAEVTGRALALDATAKAVTAAGSLGDVTILVAGADCAAAAAEAATIAGVSKVLCADDAAYGHGLAEPIGDLIVSLAGDFEHIVFPATVQGKNVAPRVAALLDVMVISDVITVNGADEFVRPVYAGNALQVVKTADAKKVMTIRTATFAAAATTGTASVETIAATANPGVSEWVEGSAENFAIIEKVADKLGAAIGASRAAVDSGYAPNDWQVGQTGKVVAPELYIAVGISGAIQHLAGMKDSKVIVAINKDEEAPIFQVADYGLVADLFEAIPALEKELG